MGVPEVSNLQHPFNEHVSPTDSEVNRELTNDVFCLPTNLTQDLLSPTYRALHQIVSSIIAPTSRISDIPRSRALFLYATGREYSCDL
ncbi:hypothetical protein U1Q18_032592, partial [Sarracenia purpurea var. burkii]